MQGSGNRGSWWILLLGALLLVAGCLSEIDLEVPEAADTSIAIRGRLNVGEMPRVSIRITDLAGFNASSIPQPVSGASVVLIDEFDRGVDVPMVRPGIYELDLSTGTSGVEVRPGRAYRLSVSTAAGENFVSDFETLYPAPEPAELRYISTRRDVLNEVNNIVNREFVRFLLTTPVVAAGSNDRSYLKWEFTGTYKFPESVVASPFPPGARTCYITERLQLEDVVTFDGSRIDGNVLRDFFILEEPFDYRFSNGFYLTVRQQSLSERAFRYWQEVGKVVDLSGNFFETPPGKVKGNFQNVDEPEKEVFGFFYAYSETIVRLYVDPGNEPPMPFCPLTTASISSVDTTCLNCLLRSGSTLIRPAFWEE